MSTLKSTGIQVPDPMWTSLYKAGSAAALAVLLLVPLQMLVFLISPPPSTVIGWFALFQRSPVVGLLDMDLLMILDTLLLGVVVLALYMCLRRFSPSLMTIALAAELVAIPTYFASNPAFEMLSLSRQHALATTEPQRAAFEAAGHAMLSTWQGTAFNVSYILMAIAPLVIAWVMRKTAVFSKTIATLGLTFGVLNLVPASAGKVGLVLSLLSLIPMYLWLALLARRLHHLAKNSSVTPTPQGRDQQLAPA
jgi:hypothetical protein